MHIQKKVIFILTACILLPYGCLVYEQLSNDTSQIYSSTKEAQNALDSNTTLHTATDDTTLINQINAYLTNAQIDISEIGISIYDPETAQRYEQNATGDFTSASLYKVPLAMLYYEYLQEGTMMASDTLIYNANCYEEGGPIEYSYQPGDGIPLSELLYDVIVYSDNTAGHILFENLGGWENYRSLIQKYSTTELHADTIAQNVFPASFGNDILIYLYEHTSLYQELINMMQLVYPDDYLSKNLTIPIAQKYGSYGTAENAMGIVYSDHPYIITITTSLGTYGIQVIADINEIVYQYFNANGT